MLVIPSANSYETVAQLSSAQGVLNVDFGTFSPLKCKGLESDRYDCTYSAIVFFSAKKTNGDWLLLDSERKLFAESLGGFHLVLVEFDGTSVTPAISSKYAEIKLDLSNLSISGGRADVSFSAITKSPDKLRPWILPIKEGSKVSKLPVLDLNDSINIQFDAATIAKKEEIANTGLTFYPSLGLKGEWRSPENRQTSGECIFGYADGDGNNPTCEQVMWVNSSDSDGFSSTFKLGMDSADDEFSTGQYSNLEIGCTAKKLSVSVYFKYASSVGWKGSGLVRFDNGSAKKFTYRVDRSFDYFWLDNPRAFTSQLLKAKNKVSFKVANQYARILVFPKSNLNQWTKKFKEAGCPIT